MIRLGVTGTDTGVGKTMVSIALLGLLRRRGLRVAAMKPCETGTEPGDRASDAALLRASAGGEDALSDVCPVTFGTPLAPWAAARQEGLEIDVRLLDTAFRRLEDGKDAILVEGAGGLLVPITRDVGYDTLFRRWELDLIVVAGNRLGVLNHALLTVRAARAEGLPIRGVVLNAIAPGQSGAAEATNHAVLAELLPDLPVVRFPWVDYGRDSGALADAAEEAGLDRLLG